MTKIAINGLGRIGRAVFKNIIEDYPDLDLVAVNDLADIESLVYLINHDTVYKTFSAELVGDKIVTNGKEVKVFNEREPENLPWADLGVDVVIECTGVFTKYDLAKKHLTAGAKRVIISAPSKEPEKIPSYILGINEQNFSDDKIIDMGSCTTNGLAPIVKVLDENFIIKEGIMTTIHSYTVSQNLLDNPGQEDPRRCRAAAENIVPTTTGAAKAISRVIPEMEGKLDGMAIRVPTPTVSVIDLVCVLEKKVTKEEINEAFILASESEKMKGILAVEKKPLVSSDYIKNPYSSIVDYSLTKVVGNSVKVISWYDNEWGYSKRLADLARYISTR